MSPGRHAAGDGSFAQSAGGAAGRGALLLAAAVALGVVLLQAFDKGSDPFASSLRTVATPTTVHNRTSKSTTPATTTTAPPRAPVDVKVLTVNGTGVVGAAGRVGDTLRNDGYNALSPTDAVDKVKTSTIYFVPGFETEAHVIAGVLGLPASTVQPLPTGQALTALVADTKSANVVIAVGPDLANRPSTTTTRRTAPSTTTTHRATTTTTSTTVR